MPNKRQPFYRKLAITNISTNRKIYTPYILMNIFMIAMFYMMSSIANDPGLSKMSGGNSVKPLLFFGVIVIGIFASLIVFYTNSFLIKRRKKEIGLYNILGLGKRHIAHMMTLETLMIGTGCLVVGLLTGIVFSKLMFMVFLKLLGFPITISLFISMTAIVSTIFLFAALFLVTMIFNLTKIHLAKPIELIRGGAVGEREPKTKWLMTIIGLLALASGYTISLMVKSPIEAISLFFIAVVLVIVGTYLLFTTASIVILKMLRSNKQFYYQTAHFSVVSGMLYRMKQNAVGLANICILSTMVIVTLTTTISMYYGLDDVLANRYPKELVARAQEAPAGLGEDLSTLLKDVAAKQGTTITDLTASEFAVLLVNATAKANDFEVLSDKFFDQKTEMVQLVTYDTYVAQQNSLAEPGILWEKPEKGQALAFVNKGEYGPDTLRMGKATAEIKGELTSYGFSKKNEQAMMREHILVFADEVAVRDFYQGATGETMPANSLVVDVDVVGTQTQRLAYFEAVKAEIRQLEVKDTRFETVYLEGRTASKKEFFMMYGGFLFLGIFLGTLFLVATVLIIYYKQISEGFDDKARFETMQKVGMSHSEIKKTISSQTVLVFFLPLVTAVIHIAFAFNVINRMLAIFNFTNTPLFMVCTAVTVFVFGIFYYGVYRLTARTYFRIVKWS